MTIREKGPKTQGLAKMRPGAAAGRHKAVTGAKGPAAGKPKAVARGQGYMEKDAGAQDPGQCAGEPYTASGGQSHLEEALEYGNS